MKNFLIYIMLSGLIVTDNPDIIADFSDENAVGSWYVVNDGVMGGLSQGDFVWDEAGYAVFSGYVTTENNGGFSSIRYAFEERDVSEFSKIVVQLKGDGKRYQFRIKESQYQQWSYIQDFTTSGDWETIEIPLSEFYPSYRGYRLNRSNFAGPDMGEIGILIGNKVKEEFRLEIKRIGLK